jgi:hypothetical protein
MSHRAAFLSCLAVSCLIGAAGAAQAQTISPTPAPTEVPTVQSVPPLPPQGQHALETAPSGTSIEWKNPDGATMTVVPQPAFQAGGKICREFQQTVTIAGRPQQAFGTACRQPDGSWKLQPASAPSAAAAPPPPSTVSPAPTVVYPPPPTVVYAYPPAYFPPGYYYSSPFYTSVYIRGGGYHHHRHW